MPLPRGFAAHAEPIRSRANPLFRRLRELKERGPEEGLALLEGVKLVEEALAAGLALREAACSPRLERGERGRRLLGALVERGVPIRRMDEGLLRALSETETTQGVLALARRPRFAEEQLFAPGTPLVVVAVGIQNPGNLGALLRTAEAAGATGAYLTHGTADPLSWKALRGSMGSAFRLPHWRGLTAQEALARLERRGLRTVATAAGAGTRYDEADLRGPVALVLGSEGSGLEERVAAACQERVAIPTAGGVESLNVGVAAGVLLFEAARQRRA